MDKYPVFREEQTVGELTVAPDALYTAFSVSCRGQEGLWCAWAVGERESLLIGVLEPENGCLQIRRRFSKRLTDPLGPILRGELRPLGEEREQWEPLRPELLRSPYLRCRLGGLSDVLTCRPERAVSSPSHGMTRPLFLWKPCFALPVPGVCRDGRTGYFALMTGNGLFFEKT